MLALLLTAALVLSAGAKVGVAADRVGAGSAAKVQAFAAGPSAPEARAAFSNRVSPVATDGRAIRPPRSVGSAQSSYAGMGIGESVDISWDDAQWLWQQGRFVATYSNGSDIVDVHFGYHNDPDTLPSSDPLWGGFFKTGYNVYGAVDGDWPRGQNVGCELQSADPQGYGYLPSLDLLEDGRVILSADSYLFGDTLPDGNTFTDNMFFFQPGQYGCYYTTQPIFTNVANIDSLVYQQDWYDQTAGNLSRDPQVATQWDGTQTITHVLLSEVNFTAIDGPQYVEGETYHVVTYYRGVGSTAETHTWQFDETQVLDTVLNVWFSLAAAPYPHTAVSACWTNATSWGGQLNQTDDNDIWYRESNDRGLNWEPLTDATNFQNAVAGHPNHFTAWLEVHSLYSTDGNLHFIFPARPTSADPYFDGYNWQDFDESLYHWDKNSGHMVKVANGVFYNDDMLSGSPNTYHCGFGGSNAGYLGWVQLAECEGKLYAVWAQIHERLNRATTNVWDAPENEHLIDDCSLNGNRRGKANWELMMSVADVTSPTLWDPARNITNTYTPNCCLAGDPDTDCEGQCGSEWKPMLEKYGLDYTGMSLQWPDNYVDMTPVDDPPYTGGAFINMAYMDDQYPGASRWPNADWANPPSTGNSIKWIRLACVEPVEASLIRVGPRSINFPEWAKAGQTTSWEVTVTNEGNVQLNVNEIGVHEETGSGWLGVSSGTMTVPAGLSNTNTFDIQVNAAGITQPTWLDGHVYLKSDALNFDSVAVSLHILAAPHVEPARWDTVFTHAQMYQDYGVPEGECVGLAVSNMGEIGWGSATGVNMDFEASGLECGERPRDHLYLATGSPYVLDADAGGSNPVGTFSGGDVVQTDADGWDPYDNAVPPTDSADLAHSLNGTMYQEVYAGKSVNRDTTIIWERWFYGPRDDINNNSFIGVINKVYTADGQAHNNLTFGVVNDWDIPAEDAPNNLSGVSTSGNFVYMQGTDTTGELSCQINTSRYGAEAFGGWTNTPCDAESWNDQLYGQVSFFQMLMEDTNQTRLGAPLSPQRPDYQAWLDDISANPGFNGYTTAEDQAIWSTYLYNYNMAGDDTLYFWSVYSTVRNGTLEDLENQVAYARTWFETNVLPYSSAYTCGGTCCQGRVGDANGSGDDEPTIGDINALISAIYTDAIIDAISSCLLEADVNQSGGLNPIYPDDFTISDINLLIEYLYIKGPYDPVYNPGGATLLNCL